MDQKMSLFILLPSRLDQEFPEGRDLVQYLSLLPALSIKPGTQLILAGYMDGWMHECMDG